MNIYLIYQTVNNNYDSYDSAVVIAATEDEAREMNPDGIGDHDISSWCEPKYVKVEHIGVTTNSRARIVCASFNAG